MVSGLIALMIFRKFRELADIVIICFFCAHCSEFCEIGDEEFCEKGCTFTYGSEPKHGRAGTEKTRGGYTSQHVVHEKFAIKIPESMDLKYAGPIM
jgi:alcohol dehydrogenase (NADP+)